MVSLTPVRGRRIRRGLDRGFRLAWPAAVNELGLVAYGNTNFVLDLWGLGSEKVRKEKLANQSGPDTIEALAKNTRSAWR